MRTIIHQWLDARGLTVLDDDVEVLVARLRFSGCTDRIRELESKLHTATAARAEIMGLWEALNTRDEEMRKFLDDRDIAYELEPWHALLDYAKRVSGELAVAEANTRSRYEALAAQRSEIAAERDARIQRQEAEIMRLGKLVSTPDPVDDKDYLAMILKKLATRYEAALVLVSQDEDDYTGASVGNKNTVIGMAFRYVNGEE